MQVNNISVFEKLLMFLDSLGIGLSKLTITCDWRYIIDRHRGLEIFIRNVLGLIHFISLTCNTVFICFFNNRVHTIKFFLKKLIVEDITNSIRL